jgi:hypothetical protein
MADRDRCYSSYFEIQVRANCTVLREKKKMYTILISEIEVKQSITSKFRRQEKRADSTMELDGSKTSFIDYNPIHLSSRSGIYFLMGVGISC